MPQATHKNCFRFVLYTLVLSVALGMSHVARAASLVLSPSSGQVTVGNIVSLKVLVNTDGKAVNNSDGIVQFPTDLLEVMSVNKGSSVFNLWVEDPKFSNSEGRITYNGGLPSPGYTGQGGEVLSIVFKAKKQGDANIVFADSSVRLNDGLGTDVLTSKQSATIQIGSAAQLEVPAVTTASNSLPAKPTVYSSTHPQQDAWYSGSTASFSWTVPAGVTSIQTLLSKSATAIPTVTYDSSVSQRTVNNLTDGVLYFHVRYLNSLGWGPVAHYKVQIDSTPPEKFAVNPTAEGTVSLAARDALSGIDSYSIRIDDQQAVRVKKDSLANDSYTLPVQNEGDHSLTVIAYDKAGNYTETKAIFTSPAIVPPTLILPAVQIQKGSILPLTGTSQYPNSDVQVTIQTSDEKKTVYTTKTQSDGSFTISTGKIDTSGTAYAWAQLVFSDTIKSPASEKKILQVNDTFVVTASKSVIYTLSFIVPAALLLLGLLFMVYLGWHKFFGLKRKLSKDLQGVVSDVHKSLMLFRDELGNQLNKLEKVSQDRDLNKREEKIFKELQGNIDTIDEFIEKRIRKIK